MPVALYFFGVEDDPPAPLQLILHSIRDLFNVSQIIRTIGDSDIKLIKVIGLVEPHKGISGNEAFGVADKGIQARCWVLGSADNQVIAWGFLVWAILVSFSDAVLKPMFLGRGVDIPMIVILLGAIGGMILSGIMGLFVGAVVLALAYRLLVEWLKETAEEHAPNPAVPE